MWRRREEKKEKLVVVEVVMGQTKSPSKRQPPCSSPHHPLTSPLRFSQTMWTTYLPDRGRSHGSGYLPALETKKYL